MLSLNATFENSIGNRHSFNLKNPYRNKPAEEIRACLQKLVELNLFEKGEVGLFKKLISAKFVETIETPIFDLRELEGMEPFAPAVEAQPQSVQASEVPATAALEVQAESAAIQQAPAAVQHQEIISDKTQLVPIQAIDIQEVPIQTSEPTGAPGELQEMEIVIPDGVDVSNLTEEDYLAIILSQLPEGAVLDSFKVEEVPSVNQEVLETSAISETAPAPVNSTLINQVSSQVLEGIDQGPEEKSSGWFKKRKSGNPLAGFSTDKRRNKKAINRWKREKNKDKKK